MGEETARSLFNEAQLKMYRLDRGQSRISDANLNPLSYNDTIGKYGYEIIITELNNLLSEVWGKLGEADKKKIKTIRNIVMDYLEFKPIFEIHNNNSISGFKSNKKINYKNWKELRELLFDYQMELNVLLEKAGYSTMSDDAVGDLLE